MTSLSRHQRSSNPRSARRHFGACALFVLSCASHPSSAATNGCSPNADRTEVVVKKEVTTSELCIDGRRYLLEYALAKRTVSLLVPDRKPLVLETVRNGFEPEKVGAEPRIRFLPLRLQAHLSQSKILYLSAERSSAGGGMGYCGAGVEMHLNILDIGSSTPRRTGSMLIESCLQNIEIADDGSGAEQLSAFSVRDGRLNVDFAFHGDSTGPGVLDVALTQFEFPGQK